MNLKDSNPFDIARKKRKPLILDSALGSLLQQRGVKADKNLWYSHLNLEAPDLVFQIHREYVTAGADILTTNTFRTNPISVAKSKFAAEQLVKEAVRICKDAADGEALFIGGSNPPAEDCYKKERFLAPKELELNHTNHIDLLLGNGVDFILNETQGHLDEIKIISDYCFKNNIPYIISIFADENGFLLSGEPIQEAIKYISPRAPLAISLNCVKPETLHASLIYLKDLNWGFYLNCGTGHFSDSTIISGISPLDYGILVNKYIDFNPSFVGSCCGSHPEHTGEIRKMVHARTQN